VKSGKLLHSCHHPDAVLSVAFGDDGRTFLTGYVGGARLWQWKPGNTDQPPVQLGTPFQHQAGIFGVALARDGRTALTGGTDGTTRLWDTTTKKPLGPPWRLAGVTFAVGFGPKDRIVLTASTSENLAGTVCLWDVPDNVDGNRDSIASWTQVVAGMQLDQGGVSVLDALAWKGLQRRMGDRFRLPQIETTLVGEKRVPTFLPAPPAHMPRVLPDKVAAMQGPGAGAPLLSYLPADAAAVAVLDVRRTLAVPLVKKHGLAQIEAWLKSADGEWKLREKAGLDPLKDIDRILVAASGSAKDSPLLVVVRGDFDRDKLRAFAMEQKGKAILSLEGGILGGIIGGIPVCELKEMWQNKSLFIALPDASTIVLSNDRAYLIAAVKGTGKKAINKQLQPLVDRVDQKRNFWLAAVLTDELKKQIENAPHVGKAASKLQTLTASLTVTDAIALNVTGNCSEAKAAKQLANALMILKGAAGLAAEDYPPIAGKVLEEVKITAEKESVVITVKISEAMIDEAAKLGGAN
jgi:hypothetical protein